MKKLLKVFLALSMVLGLYACSQDTSSIEPEVKAVVENYFGKVKEGDYKAAMEYCTSDVDDGFGLKNLDEMIENELTSANLGEDFNNAAKDWLTYTVSNTFEDYNIKEITVDGDTAQVIVTGKSIDFNAFNATTLEDDLTAATENYVNENTQKLQDLVLSVGEEEAMNQFVAELSTFVFDNMKTYVDEIERTDYAIRFTLTKSGDQWSIHKIEHTLREDA